MNSPRSFKRRQVYIKKDFQNKFILKFFLILIFSGAITIGLTFFTTHGTLTTSYINSKLVIQNTALAILPSVIYTTLITTLIVGVAVILVTLLVSHKIAGPMCRFEKDIQRVAKGDLKSRITIRKGDQFQELAFSLNQMIDSLALRVGQIRTLTDSLAGEKELTETARPDLSSVRKKIDDNFIL